MVKNSGNPQVMLQQMLGNNPQYGRVMKLVQDNGGDAKQTFYALANQMGIDPEQIINALK